MGADTTRQATADGHGAGVEDADADWVRAGGPAGEAAAAMPDTAAAGNFEAPEPAFADIDLAAIERGDLAIDEAELHVLSTGLLAAKRWQLRTKRCLDIACAALALALLSPLLLLTALLVAVDSHGPALYRQERVGRGGRRFKMLKFRSMYVGAHDERHHIESVNEASGPVFKMRDDPRVTRVGRVIRKLSIDELPQFWNVLRGDMSLVGPRPPLPEEFVEYGRAHNRRLLVTPGLTCIWQVSGRSDIDFEDWVAMDVEYITTWTLRRDLVLIARTVPAVLSGKGAY